MNDVPTAAEGFNAPAVYSKRETVEDFLTRVETEVRSHVPDVSSKKGRDAIAALAYKVSRTKTAADDAGKAMMEEAKKIVDEVNGHRKVIRDRLDALRDEARRPLNEWEAAEDARQRLCKAIIEGFKNTLSIPADAPVDALEISLAEAQAVEISMPRFADYLEEAKAAKQAAIDHLGRCIVSSKRIAAERAELERLRKEAAEREERERVEREQREAEEARKAEEAARAERERVAEERRLADIKAAEERAAAEALAKADQERRAAEERAAREAQAEIDRVRAEEAEKTRIAQEAAAKLQREADERAAAERTAREAEAARQRDVEHRRLTRAASATALSEHAGLSAEQALAAFDAVAAGIIPNMVVRF